MNIICPGCLMPVRITVTLEERHLNQAGGDHVIHVTPHVEHTCPQPPGREPLPIAA